jgi:hypothetical protein
MSAELCAIEDRIDAHLGRYKSLPVVIPVTDRKAGIVIDYQFLNRNLPLIESQVFSIVLRLVEHGELVRLSRCPREACHKWFFAAGRIDQKYCSTACRQADFEATEERREYNRKKQAEYYARNRTPAALRPYRPRARGK